MIITLAGHVDHGKTSIVRALTGIDTDRLEEEKRRGLTIDLGFAYTNVGDARLGFVDVPGHHRFIHNMVAGVAHQQHALLVVAADDSVMPQTREHLAILQLLGVRDGVVALNKVDRVDPERVRTVRQDIVSLLAGTFLEGAAIIEVSCVDGRGVEELKSHLTDAAERVAIATSDREFRLAVDRAFTVRGAGVIVTGTVVAGTVHLNDPLALAATGQPVRLRGLHVQDAPAQSAGEGDRTAMNLTGIGLEDVARGDWIVAEATHGTTNHVVVELEVLADFPRAVRHWAPAHVYLATSHSQGRIGLLAGSPIEPGANALVDLVLHEPLHVKIADRLIVRDHDLGRTLGGGRVVDVSPPTRRRRSRARLSRLDAARNVELANALAALAAMDAVESKEFRRNWNLTALALANVIQAQGLIERGDFIIHTDLLAATRTSVAETLARHHDAQRDSDGMTPDTIAASVAVSRHTADIALEALVDAGEIRSKSGHFALASHVAEIPKALATLFERVEPLLDSRQPPSLGDLAKSMNRPLAAFEREMRALAAIGLCAQVSANRFFLKDRLRDLTEVALRLHDDGGFTVRQFRDASTVGRNIVIEVLEHFDRKGFTRREGDVRRIVGSASLVID